MVRLKGRTPSISTLPKKRSISTALTLIIVLTVVVVTIVTIFLINLFISLKAKSQLEEKSNEYVHSLAAVLEMPVWNLNYLSIQKTGEAYALNDIFEKIKITGVKGNVYYEFYRQNHAATVSRSGKIVHNGQTIGFIEIALTEKAYSEMNRRLLLSAMITLLAVVFVLVVVTGYFSRRLLHNLLDRLNGLVGCYASGRFEASVPDMPFLEFQPLVDVLGEMGARIDAQITELREAEQKYRSIFEGALEGIFQSTPEGRILSANPYLARILGYDSPEDFLGAISDIGTQLYANPEKRMEFLRLMKAGDAVAGFQVQVYRKDRSKIWVSLHARPVLAKSGDLVMVEGIVEDISQRKLAESALEDSEAMVRSILDNLDIGVVLISLEMKTLEVNRRIREWFPDADPGKSHLCYHMLNDPPRESICDDCPTHKTLQDGKIHETVSQISRAGVVRTYRIVASPIHNASGEVTAVIEIFDDITEKLSLESQFLQSQKMEAIGLLAGGVAHDFNNLLTIILGYGEIMIEDLQADHSHHDSLEEIIRAGVRAKELTHQLLAFSRKQVLEVALVDVNHVVAGFERLLRRLIGEDIALQLELTAEPCLAMADTHQLEQVFMNLAVNSRDAMPDGGKLIIKTSLTDLDETYAASRPDVIPGRYVRISISDTGYGMSKDTMEHIFDPFFTTKGEDKGTGLGLATSYGIIKQHDGWIWVYSEPGEGTTFNIYLPFCKEKVVSEKRDVTTLGNLKGWETILLAEDNETVRHLAITILKRQGYNVIPAGSGEEAKAVLENHTGPLHLLLTDVIMPGINGSELFSRVSARFPQVKVIYMSGYTDDLIAYRGVIDEGVHFIQKPFSVKSLSVKVRVVLDEGE